MKYTVFILSIFLLASCVQKEDPEMILHTQSLEQEIAALKVENTNLKAENDLCKTWGGTGTIQTGSTETTESQVVEWSFSSCMQEAHRIYNAQSSDYCKKVGFTSTDIAANNCHLDKKIVERLQNTKSQAEWECYNLYQ